MVVGSQKALKMTNDKLFNLSKDLKDKKNNLNIKFTNNLKKNILKVIKSFNAYLIHNCDIFKNFTGRDIDAFFKKTKQLKKINNNAIYRDFDEKSLRIHLNEYLDLTGNASYIIFQKSFDEIETNSSTNETSTASINYEVVSITFGLAYRFNILFNE